VSLGACRRAAVDLNPEDAPLRNSLPIETSTPPWLLLVLGFAFSLSPSNALAQSPSASSLQAGIERYQEGDYDEAAARLEQCLTSGLANSRDRVEALLHLAAARHAQGKLEEARRAATELLRQEPETEVSAGLFPPRFLELMAAVRAELQPSAPRDAPAALESQDSPLPSNPGPASQDTAATPGDAASNRPTLEPELPTPMPPVRLAEDAPRAIRVDAPLPEPRRASLGAALIPFGVGQFANGSPRKGAVFLASETIAFATSAVTFVLFESSKLPGSPGAVQCTAAAPCRFENPRTADALQLAYLTAFYTGVALMVAGIADALLERAGSDAQGEP